MGREGIPGRDAIVWIYDEWLKTNPRQGAVVVEVGVALGKSISYLVERLDELGRDDVEVYAVDTWAGSARNGEQQQLADAAGGDFSLYAKMMLEHAPKAFERVRVLRADSARAVDFFEPRVSSVVHAPVDLVILDADHTEAAVLRELQAWSDVLRKDGWIGGDDHHETEFPGVIAACRRFFGDGYEVSTDNPYGWPIWLKRGAR